MTSTFSRGHLFIITLDHKAATVQQLHYNEGWTFDEALDDNGTGYNYLASSYIAAPTKREGVAAYENLTGIAWTQKQGNVRCERVART